MSRVEEIKLKLVLAQLEGNNIPLRSCKLFFDAGCSNTSSKRLFEYKWHYLDPEPIYCTPCENHVSEFLDPKDSTKLANGWEEVR